MLELPLWIFAETEDFPFFIQYGFHEEECELHGHQDFSELVVVLEGSAMHIVEQEKYPIAEGDVFVIDQYTHHRYVEAKNFKICNIMFRPGYMFANLHHIRQNIGFQALFILEPYYAQNHHFCSRLRLKLEDFTAIRKLLAEMIQEHTQKPSGWQTLIYAKFIQLCIVLSRLYQTYDNQQDNNIFKLAAAVAHIEQNYCSHIDISQLAQLAGYSERQFGRLFKAAFSTTPNLYIMNLRLQKAQQLLKNSNLTIGEISWNCGYSDQNYFSRIFKRYVGLTPTEYQENVLG